MIQAGEHNRGLSWDAPGEQLLPATPDMRIPWALQFGSQPGWEAEKMGKAAQKC